MTKLLDAVLDLGALGVLVGLLLAIWGAFIGVQIAATALVVAVIAAILLGRVDRAGAGRPRPATLGKSRVRRDTISGPHEETHPTL